MTDLSTLNSFQAWYGEAIPDPDVAGVEALITAYSQWVRSYCSRDFDQRGYTRRFDGRDNATILLPQYPIVAIASVTICGTALAAQSAPGQYGYWFDEDSVNLDGCRFPWGRGNVVISWTAGYATIPVDISQAVNEIVGLRYATRDKQGWSSKTLAGETVAIVTKDMPASVQTVLDQYARRT